MVFLFANPLGDTVKKTDWFLLFAAYCFFGAGGSFGYMLYYAMREKWQARQLEYTHVPMLPSNPQIRMIQYWAFGRSFIEVMYNGQKVKLTPLQHDLLVLVDKYGRSSQGLTCSLALRERKYLPAEPVALCEGSPSKGLN